MNNDKGLVILHIDGLGYHDLRKAIAQGLMPFTQCLIESEDYEAQPYRCGVPSTTPFCQAGILYGDNSNIPSFRWWDKESGLLVVFGGNSSFVHVAHKYFQGCEPLIEGGACIASCYPAGAKNTFGLAYRDKGEGSVADPHSGNRVLLAYLSDPRHLLDWLYHGTLVVAKTALAFWRAWLGGHRTARKYVFADLLEEIFLHHLTRFAVRQAMRENYPIIYGGFYAYDETGHAFGPEGEYTRGMLRHIDETIERVARVRSGRPGGGREYELVILSDHGQIETIPFVEKSGKHLADFVAEWLPNYSIQEFRGSTIEPAGAIDGHIALTYSGGLGHLYFTTIPGRLEQKELERRFPGLATKLAQLDGIEFVLLKDGPTHVICSRKGEFRFNIGTQISTTLREFLSPFDDPDILALQLARLNSFERSGDLILFGAFEDGKQINFETQVGGHGSIGGEQLHPFVLAPRDSGIDARGVTGADELHIQLKRLRDRLLGDRERAGNSSHDKRRANPGE